jgi:hypothetical protein
MYLLICYLSPSLVSVLFLGLDAQSPDPSLMLQTFL